MIGYIHISSIINRRNIRKLVKYLKFQLTDVDSWKESITKPLMPGIFIPYIIV